MHDVIPQVTREIDDINNDIFNELYLLLSRTIVIISLVN
jgi:hypothetical protein